MSVPRQLTRESADRLKEAVCGLIDIDPSVVWTWEAESGRVDDHVTLTITTHVPEKQFAKAFNSVKVEVES